MKKEIKTGEVNEVEKAQQILAKVEQEKREAFAKEIDEVCKKHGFRLDVVSQIVANKI